MEVALNALTLSSILVLVALGLAIVFGLMNIINMAHGEFVMLGAFTLSFVQSKGGNFWLGLIAAIIVGAALGFVLERLIVRHLYARPMAAILATWGISLILQHGMQLLFGAGATSGECADYRRGQRARNNVPAYRLFLIASAVAIVGAAVLAMRKTAFGLDLRAVIGNREIAELHGIDSRHVFTVVVLRWHSACRLGGRLGSPACKSCREYGRQLFGAVILRGDCWWRWQSPGRGCREPSGRYLADDTRSRNSSNVFPSHCAGCRRRYRPGEAARLGTSVTIADTRKWSDRRRPSVRSACITLIVVLLLIYPLWASDYQIGVARDALILGILALSLDFLWGKAGILSFGQAAFFGIGAYAVAILGPRLGGGDAFLAGLCAGLALAAVVAGVVGYFLLYGGVRGPYLTIVTLALSLVAERIATGWANVTGGDAGLLGSPPPGLAVAGWSAKLETPLSQYLLVLCLLGACTYGIARWCAGRRGVVFTALQDNELRLRALGYDTAGRLLAVFVVVKRHRRSRRIALCRRVWFRRAGSCRPSAIHPGDHLGRRRGAGNAAGANSRRIFRDAPADRGQQHQLRVVAAADGHFLRRIRLPVPRGIAALRATSAHRTCSTARQRS